MKGARLNAGRGLAPYRAWCQCLRGTLEGKVVLEGCKPAGSCLYSSSVQMGGVCAGAGGQVQQVGSQT